MEQLKCHSGAAPSAPFISGAALTLAVERRITHEHTEEKKTFLWVSDLMTCVFVYFRRDFTFSAATGKQTRQTADI